LAAAQKEIDDKAAKAQKEIDDKAAELDRIRQENEKAAADKMAEQQKKMDEQQALLDKQKADQEKAEAAEKQRKEDEAFAELEEKQRKEKEAADAEAKKVRDAELYKRLPEDVKMRSYGNALLALEPPKVESEEMKQLIVDVTLKLGHVAAFIYENTQSASEAED
jgi:membrane protein involved in colicin uptake